MEKKPGFELFPADSGLGHQTLALYPLMLVRSWCLGLPLSLGSSEGHSGFQVGKWSHVLIWKDRVSALCPSAIIHRPSVSNILQRAFVVLVASTYGGSALRVKARVRPWLARPWAMCIPVSPPIPPHPTPTPEFQAHGSPATGKPAQAHLDCHLGSLPCSHIPPDAVLHIGHPDDVSPPPLEWGQVCYLFSSPQDS